MCQTSLRGSVKCCMKIEGSRPCCRECDLKLVIEEFLLRVCYSVREECDHTDCTEGVNY